MILPENWSDWRINKELGRGRYYVIFEAERIDDPTVRRAIKLVATPQDPSEYETLISSGFTEQQSQTLLTETSNPHVPPPEPPPPPPRKGVLWTAIVAVLLCLAFLVLGMFLGSSDHRWVRDFRDALGIETPLPPTPLPTAVPSPTPVPTATATPEVTATPMPFAQGDCVTFGRYAQHDRTGQETEPIEWLVLDTDFERGRVFVLSRYALEGLPFNSSASAEYTWENSTLRDWLNRTFLTTAFTTEEQEAISETEVDNSAAQGLTGWDSAGRAGDSTRDKVFLLSAREVQKYLIKNEWLLCATTPYSDGKVYKTTPRRLNGRDTCDYWLRSAAYKNQIGDVEANGRIGFGIMYYASGAVRPAMWVDVSVITKTE